MEKWHKRSRYTFGILLLLFFIWMAAQIPYTHDDWDWASPMGMDWLLHATVNSRYAGNLVVVLLTRSRLLKTLVMGLCFFFLPLLAVPVATGRKPLTPGAGAVLLLLSFALFTGIPELVWNQTNGWVAGFANFSFSALVLLAFLHLVRVLWEGKEGGWPQRAACLLTGFVIQLFLENLTIYVLAVSLCLFVVCAVRDKRLSLSALALLLGALLGTVLMFSSQIYGGLLETGKAVGGYRALTVDLQAGLPSLVIQVIYNFVAVVLPELYAGFSWGYTVVLLALLSILLWLRRREWKKPAFVLLLTGNLILLVYHAGQSFGLLYRLCGGDTRYMAILRLISGLFLVFVVSLQLFLLEKDRKRSLFALGLWLSIPLVLLPLSVVNTVGPRSFLTSQVFHALLILAVMDTLLPKLGCGQRRALAALAGTALLLICLNLGSNYWEIGRISRERDRILAQAREQGLQEVTIPDYPDKSLLWLPNNVEMYSFRSFYGLDPDIVIRIAGETE